MHSQRMAQLISFVANVGHLVFTAGAGVQCVVEPSSLWANLCEKNGSSKITWNWVRLDENKQIWLKMAQVIPSENSPTFDGCCTIGRCPRRFAPVREQLQLHSFQAKRCHSRAPKSDLWHKNNGVLRRDRIPCLHLSCHSKWPNYLLDNAINQHAASKKGLIYVNSSPVCQKWIEMGCINYPLQVQIDVWVYYIATIHDINYNPSRKSVDQK